MVQQPQPAPIGSPGPPQPLVQPIAPWMITSTFELPGFRIVQNRGVVRGIVVRSRSIFGTIGASLQTLVGGNITIWSQLCEQARQEAFEIMALHAAEIGANAIVAMRYDATEISSGVTEVLAYGSAVIVEQLPR